MTRRQPLTAKVWDTIIYRSWWWCEGSRHKKEAKRRSARRERAMAKREIRDSVTGSP